MEALIKDPATVAREMAELEQLGVDHVIFFATFPGYPLSKTMQTWEAFAGMLIPRLRAQTVSPLHRSGRCRAPPYGTAEGTLSPWRPSNARRRNRMSPEKADWSRCSAR
jgi:hypothetical protein